LQTSTFISDNFGSDHQGDVSYRYETIDPALLDNRHYPSTTDQNELGPEIEPQDDSTRDRIQDADSQNQSLLPSPFKESTSIPLHSIQIAESHPQRNSVPQLACESCPSLTFSWPYELK